MPNVDPSALQGGGRLSIPIALESFQRLAELWELSTEDQIQLLGSPGRSTYFKWKKEGGILPRDTLERISHILAIYKALQILLPDAKSADEWIKKPNAFFDGRSALMVMLGGQVVDIYRVRQYVDAQRGG